MDLQRDLCGSFQAPIVFLLLSFSRCLVFHSGVGASPSHGNHQNALFHMKSLVLEVHFKHLESLVNLPAKARAMKE